MSQKRTEEKKTRNKGTHYIFRLFLWFICNMCNTVRYYWLIKEINKPAADCFILRHFKLRSIIKTTQWFPKVLIHTAHEKTNKTNMFSLFLTESESKEGCKNSHGHCLIICWLYLFGGAEKWEHFPPHNSNQSLIVETFEDELNSWQLGDWSPQL